MQVVRFVAGCHAAQRALFVACIAAGGFAGAEDYPTKPVRVIVPISAGGGTDVAARIVAWRLSKASPKNIGPR
jgi:tripartite-type tricarboxylate transporter receptor subunit TctC